MRVDGGVGGCVCLFFKCVCVCVLLFDQRWQSLLSLMRFPLLRFCFTLSISFCPLYPLLFICSPPLFQVDFILFIDFYSKSSLKKL